MIDLETGMKELAEAPRNTHNKRSLIRTPQVCHRRLAIGSSQQAEEYKYTHTYTHTHTHTHILAMLFWKLVFTCSKSAAETVEQNIRYVSS